jgi:putative ABC transport system permease protein
MASTVQAILGILGALGILVLFLSSSLIANTLSSLLNQHLRHIGVMKLVGARRNQVVQMYILLIVGFSLLALGLAVPLGGQGAYGLAQFIADKLNFHLMGYRIVQFALLIQIIIGLAVPILVGLIPVVRGSRISVQRALSSDTAGEGKRKTTTRRFSLYDWIDHLFREKTSRRGIHFPRPLLISLRNTFRHKGRLALTLFTLTMGGAIFIAVFNARVTLHDYIDRISDYFLADVSLDFDRAYRMNDIRSEAMQVPGVLHVEGWTFADGEALYPDGTIADNITILAPPATSTLVDPMMVSGRWLQPGDQKAITLSDDIYKQFPTLQPGDSLRMKVFGKEDDWKVVGIFKFVSQEGTIGYATYEYLAHLSNQSNQAFTYRVLTEKHDPQSQKEMSDRLDQYFRENGYQIREAKTGTSTMKTAAESLDILIAFLLIMAVLTASVGSIGLAGAMSMNVMERTREIGIMRSIGAIDKKIMEMVIIEGTVVGGLAWFLGALVSVPITYLLTTIVSLAIFNSPIEILFTWSGYLLWLGVVLVLSALASVIPARNAARLTIREVLAYE